MLGRRVTKLMLFADLAAAFVSRATSEHPEVCTVLVLVPVSDVYV